MTVQREDSKHNKPEIKADASKFQCNFWLPACQIRGLIIKVYHYTSKITVLDTKTDTGLGIRIIIRDSLFSEGQRSAEHALSNHLNQTQEKTSTPHHPPPELKPKQEITISI